MGWRRVVMTDSCFLSNFGTIQVGDVAQFPRTGIFGLGWELDSYATTQVPARCGYRVRGPRAEYNGSSIEHGILSPGTGNAGDFREAYQRYFATGSDADAD